MTGPALRERLRGAAIPSDGQAFIAVMFAASLRGAVVRGPMIGRQHAYVLAQDWLPRGPRSPRSTATAALAELARRYLAGHGPADEARPRPLGRHPPRATPAPASRRSRASCRRRRTGWSTSSAAARGRALPRPACWVPTSRSCSAGARGPTCSPMSRRAWSRAASSAVSRLSTARRRPCGGSSIARSRSSRWSRSQQPTRTR